MKISLIIIILFSLCAVPCYGAIRNPFLPQLPREEIKVVVPPAKNIQSNRQQQKKSVATKGKRKTTQKKAAVTKQPDAEKPPEPVVFPSFKISGVIWNSTMPQAIINDTVVSEGDTIQGVKIESIKPQSIKLSYKGVTRTIAP